MFLKKEKFFLQICMRPACKPSTFTTSNSTSTSIAHTFTPLPKVVSEPPEDSPQDCEDLGKAVLDLGVVVRSGHDLLDKVSRILL